jgi:DNA-binding winged helix-turn-helix (wHTH) protein
VKSSESNANPPVAQLYQFGGYVLDPVRRRLRQLDGTWISLPPRVFDTLLFLVERNGSVVDKERLMAAVWPGSLVEDNNLSQSISTLRHLFGEKPGARRFIVTVPGRRLSLCC